ncbi:unnamed protein product [Effrenium voratum]|nr:unnamed protein product [Effrenium voratum]
MATQRLHEAVCEVAAQHRLLDNKTCNHASRDKPIQAQNRDVKRYEELKTEVHASKEKMSKEMCDQTRQRFENTKKIVADKAVAESSLSKKEDKLRTGQIPAEKAAEGAKNAEEAAQKKAEKRSAEEKGGSGERRPAFQPRASQVKPWAGVLGNAWVGRREAVPARSEKVQKTEAAPAMEAEGTGIEFCFEASPNPKMTKMSSRISRLGARQRFGARKRPVTSASEQRRPRRSYRSLAPPCHEMGDEELDNVAEAARLQHTHLVAELLAAGKDVDAKDEHGNTALHWSCLLGLESLTSLLLAHDARTDIANESGSFAVHAAAQGRNVSALKMLCSDKDRHTGPEVFVLRDAQGCTAFLLAAKVNDASLMEWLYLQGVSLEQRDLQGRTAVMLACQQGNIRTLQYLISCGASLLERDNDGRNALHLACADGRQEVLKMLLDTAGLSILDSRDAEGHTASAIARQNGHWVLAVWLTQVDLLQAMGSARSWCQDFLSRSVWATAFWTLLLLNFCTVAALAPYAPEAQVMLWCFLVSCTAVCWWHLAVSDPGYLEQRRCSSMDQVQEAEIQKLMELWLMPWEKQVEQLDPEALFWA